MQRFGNVVRIYICSLLLRVEHLGCNPSSLLCHYLVLRAMWSRVPSQTVLAEMPRFYASGSTLCKSFVATSLALRKFLIC